MFLDYYEILAIDPDATQDEVKQAYRKCARESHPDMHPHETEFQTGEMKLINEAYTVLRNRKKRLEYDYEWKRHYRIKGEIRKREISNTDITGDWTYAVTEKVLPIESARLSEIPFWKDQRVLVGILVVLVIILAADIYITYFRGRPVGSGIARDVALGYEYALGSGFRENSSERHYRHYEGLPSTAVDERIFHLMRALDLDPDNLPAALAAAELMCETGMYEEALDISRGAVLRLDEIPMAGISGGELSLEKNARTRFLEISYQSYNGLGMYNEAYTTLLELRRIEPEDEKILLDLSVAEFRTFRESDALAHLTELVDTYPESPFITDAKIALAQVYLKIEQYDKAIETGLEVIDKVPDDPILNEVLGKAYFSWGRGGDPIIYLERALDGTDHPDEIHYVMGLVYSSRGYLDDATSELNEAIRLNPDYFDAFMRLGWVYENLDMPEEARSAYFRALQIDPRSGAARDAIDRLEGLSGLEN